MVDIVVNRSLIVTEDMETCPHLTTGDKAAYVVYAKESNTVLATKGYCSKCYLALKVTQTE